MILSVFVLQQDNVHETLYTVIGAWDEYSRDENECGFREELERHQKKYGADSVRVLEVKIPEGALAKPFEIPEVKGEVDG